MSNHSFFKQNSGGMRRVLCILVGLSLPTLALAVDNTTSSFKSEQANPQKTHKIVGSVLEAKSGQPIIGATIIVQGQRNRGTATDLNGRFELQVSEGEILEVSSVGFITLQQKVSSAKQITIRLNEDYKALNEVLVVGYGTQKKVNLTGAVASVDSKMMANRPTANLMSSIQGAVPGVTIMDRPGGGVSLNIRGRGNLGESNPLYVVDGVEVSASYFASLNPNTIENVTFLKDAASAAIYGAKAAYGVVLVTTKTARSGHLEVSYDGSFGVKSPTYLPNIVSSGQYAEMWTAAELNSGVKADNLTFKPEMIKAYYDGSDPDRYPNTNWFDLVLNKQALFTKHNLQFNGGSDKFKYILNTGFLFNDNLYKKNYSNRFDVSAKTVAQLKPWLKITSSANLIKNASYRNGGSISSVELLRVPPTQVAIHSNGEWGTVRNGRTTTQEDLKKNQARNLAVAGRSESETTQLLGILQAEIKPFSWLKITNQIGYDSYDYHDNAFDYTYPGVPNFLSPKSGNIPGSDNTLNEMSQRWFYSRKFVYDGWLNADKTFANVHNLSFMLGTHTDIFMEKSMKVGRQDFASNEMRDLSGGSLDPKKQKLPETYFNEESMNSFFARLGYNYDNKYLLEANFRADASSRFASKGRWGYFPSFSAGWRLDKERFMSFITPYVNLLKVRASWGRNGNIKNIGLYDTYSIYSTTSTAFQGGEDRPVYAEAQIGNPDLTWERTTTTDLGLDLTVKNGLLRLTADYYNRLTDGILVKANDIPVETGLSGNQIPSRNVGMVRNTGLELSLSHSHTIKDFSYEIGANMTLNKNRIESLGDKVNELPPNGNYIMRVGHSIGDFYMYQANGLYSEDDIKKGNYVLYNRGKGGIPIPGSVRYIDQLTEDTDKDGIPDKADGILNDKDRVIVGNDVPSFSYGLNASIAYKGFNLSVTGQGVTGTKVYLSAEASMAFFDYSVPRAWQLDNWTPQNQNATYPILLLPSNQNYKRSTQTSSFWLFDSSYFRIKNITLSYTIPQSLLSKIKLTGARVYLTGENLFTLRGDKRMKDFDPETVGGRGYNIGTKTITAGLSIHF